GSIPHSTLLRCCSRCSKSRASPLLHSCARWWPLAGWGARVGVASTTTRLERNRHVSGKEKANDTTRNRCPERCAHRHWNLWWQLEGQTPYRVRGSCGTRGRQACHDRTG